MLLLGQKAGGSCGFVRVLVPTFASLPGLYGVLQVNLDWEAFTHALPECPRFLALPKQEGEACMGRLIGYARVSTAEQELQLQLDALDKTGWHPVFTDKASGAHTKRSGLDACVKALEPGDTLVVWRLDRLGRSMPHLMGLVEELLGKGIGFRSLLDGAIDTTTASGELMFHIFSSLAQFERRLVQEGTRAGLAAARARGRLGGRWPIQADDPRVVTAKRLHKDRSLSINEICKTLGISRPTFYRYLAL